MSDNTVLIETKCGYSLRIDPDASYLLRAIHAGAWHKPEYNGYTDKIFEAGIFPGHELIEMLPKDGPERRERPILVGSDSHKEYMDEQELLIVNLLEENTRQRTAFEGEAARLRKALETILAHQERIGGSIAEYSTTAAIARKALNPASKAADNISIKEN